MHDTSAERRIPVILRTVLPPFAAAAVGGAATAPAIGGWYRELKKPPFNPPDRVFGPVWSVLYVLMGVAAYIVDRDGDGGSWTATARAFNGVQLGLNALWSVLFFGRRSPLAGMIEIVFLWVAILLTILTYWRISRPAALLLLPYLLWTTFAALLNVAIWQRNR